ncbi:hypothetical protein CR513_11173, partial [Mucuna pruriens]
MTRTYQGYLLQAYGKERVFERMSGNKGSTQMWVNVVEHPSTSQLDQNIQAFSKEEMDRLRALLNSTSKSLGLCCLTMKVSKEQLITIANGDHVPIVGFGNIQIQSSLSLHNNLQRGGQLVLLKSRVGYTTYNIQRCP